MDKIKTGIKMVVSPEQSRKVQEICFENDIEWASGTYIKYIDKPFLYINDSYLLGCGKDFHLFYRDKNEEVSAELFIRTNGTCVESETLTENNNKGEQMEELKLECLVRGYEGTYFKIGQVWQIKSGDRLKVKEFDFEIDIYKLIMTEVDDSTPKYYYTPKGEELQGKESELDLVKLISTEATPSKESQPKTLSEYLKEKNVYEAFIENCVARALLNPKRYEYIRDTAEDIDEALLLINSFIWADTKEGHTYWEILQSNIPKPIVYDMNEIIFAEVDNRIAKQKTQSEFISTEEFEQIFEQKAPTKYMVFVEGRSTPKKLHDSYDSAEKEAKKLSAKEISCNVMVLSVVKTFKSKVIVEEVK